MTLSFKHAPQSVFNGGPSPTQTPPMAPYCLQDKSPYWAVGEPAISMAGGVGEPWSAGKAARVLCSHTSLPSTPPLALALPLRSRRSRAPPAGCQWRPGRGDHTVLVLGIRQGACVGSGWIPSQGELAGHWGPALSGSTRSQSQDHLYLGQGELLPHAVPAGGSGHSLARDPSRSRRAPNLAWDRQPRPQGYQRGLIVPGTPIRRSLSLAQIPALSFQTEGRGPEHTAEPSLDPATPHCPGLYPQPLEEGREGEPSSTRPFPPAQPRLGSQAQAPALTTSSPPQMPAALTWVPRRRE